MMVSFGLALCLLLIWGKQLLITAGSVITRQERSNDIITLNCEALKRANQVDLVWKVRGAVIAYCDENLKCKVTTESLEADGIKVLSISRGTLSIKRSSRNTASRSVDFLCKVYTEEGVLQTEVKIDFIFQCPQTTPSTSTQAATTEQLGNGSYPKVQTESGAIVGKITTLPHGKSVHEYLGIPYAEPPVGELRFAAPKPAKPWSGIKEAKEFGAACPQPEFPVFLNFTNEVGEENEDCLFLNVFVPSSTKPGDKMAVMVWIHGGHVHGSGFSLGSSTEYPGHVLAAFNDVIVVTFNYRLGILGFLNIPGTAIKGNYGMFDQILALKWVQDNIASFGGDPSRVTIFGQSAGGMSVSLHLISPLSKGLFQRAIMQSGVASSPSLSGKETSADTVKKFATAANCPSDEKLIGCLSSKSAEEIISLQTNLSSSSTKDLLELINPSVDGDFMTDTPRKLYRHGKCIHNVDVVMGFTSHEASLGVLLGPGNASQDGVSKEEFEASVRRTLEEGGVKNKTVEERVKDKYTYHNDPKNKITARERMIHLQNDFLVVAPTIFQAKALTKVLTKAGKNTYLYVFEHRPDFSPLPEWAGAVHGVDIGFVFGAPFRRVSSLVDFFTAKYSHIEKGFSWYIMKLWTDFAKFGSPTPPGSNSSPITWRPFTKEDQFYLALDVKPKLKQKYRAKEATFWNKRITKVTKPAKRRKKP